ncbi:N-formylglutamate amidohydrolase [Pararhizobium haloflavum]|uniref:N-formylglutamate amidohydrolase n=1 Tax=Pararhizobium haloflavum TaxID=2037914 RepID=UPI001FDEC32C|nr:N-formylglutamate amidohydrolase [Pararhizobium haloflavum]
MTIHVANDPGDDVGLPHEAGDWWTIHTGEAPVIATAIHNGHAVRPEVADDLALGEQDRLREEDPFTEYTTRDVPNRIICHHSRFEFDLNRARDEAIYVRPEQSWGLKVWKEQPSASEVEASLSSYDEYYAMLRFTLERMQRRHGHFVLLDIHSYNHRRDGPDAPPRDEVEAPEINIGTFSMDRARWAGVVDPFIEHLRSSRLAGRAPDVRENVAFQGKGEQTRFVHTNFPTTGCAIAIEFKKMFMDEWTGQPDRVVLDDLRQMIRTSLPVLEQALGSQ